MDKRNILNEIAQKTKERIEVEKREVPVEELKQKIKMQRDIADIASNVSKPTFFDNLKKPGMSFICEVKKASTVQRSDCPGFSLSGHCKRVRSGGSLCNLLSDEPYYFQGSDKYLEEIADTVNIPVLRKDFTVDEYMIYQAKAFGASAILLICAILDDARLKAYRELAESLKMDALVEAHDEEEITRALKSGSKNHRVNNRDLKNISSRYREQYPASQNGTSKCCVRL